MNNNQYYKAHKRVRKTWGISPVEKVVKSKKEYDRSVAKKQVKEVIEDEIDDWFEWYNDPVNWNI
jgi:hypothetical protein